MIAVDRLPPEIRESARALVWRYELRDGKPKPTKVPYNPRRPSVPASTTDPVTWGLFAEAHAVVGAGKADGVGIVLGDDGDGIISGVDLDECRDPRTGAIASEAHAIVQALDSYTEISPSGTGLHTLARGGLPPGRRSTGKTWGGLPPGCRRLGKIEMYDTARYFTITGEHLPETPATIAERTAELATLHARIFAATRDRERAAPPPRRPYGAVERDDVALIERACAARNGAKFTALFQRGDWSAYPTQSEADQALANLLAYWTGGDAARVDRLFRGSGLIRAKWDARSDYRERTIAKAIAGCAERAS